MGNADNRLHLSALDVDIVQSLYLAGRRGMMFTKRHTNRATLMATAISNPVYGYFVYDASANYFTAHVLAWAHLIQQSFKYMHAIQMARWRCSLYMYSTVALMCSLQWNGCFLHVCTSALYKELSCASVAGVYCALSLPWQ